MLAVFTEEQKSLASTAVSLGRKIGITNPADLDQRDRAAAWGTLADTGLLGIRVREDGSPAASGVEAMVVARELGAILAPTPFAAAGILPIELLSLCHADEAEISAIAAGETRVALILDANLRGLAEMSNRSDMVAWGHASAEYGYALQMSGDVRQVVRVRMSEGFKPADGVDLTSTVSPALHGVDHEYAVVGRAVSDADYQRWLGLALTLVSADCAGAIHAALDGVVEYSKSRIAYNVPIGSFQALQHMCADAFVECEAADSTINYAAWALDALDAREALLAARTAKAYVSAVARGVCETVMQVYGGIGQTWEHMAHFYARRTLLDTYLLGDTLHQLDQIYSLRNESL
jgi:alkylation response protein AidB-like acyl-CoA dehydrogenase